MAGSQRDEPLEIERKFLIRYPDLLVLEQLCSSKADITQTYLKPEPGITRRVRKREFEDVTEFWFTEKERISDITRVEREQQISEARYQELLQEADPDARVIRKTRYFLPSGDLCFEVDLFPEWDDRAFAEVELEDENGKFEIPPCLEVIKEVTDDPRYTNAALARNGFVYEEIK